MSRKKGQGTGWLIAALAVALIAVLAVIAWKQREYGVSEQFYEGLRGMLRCGGMRI